jgi:hypothetical protein
MKHQTYGNNVTCEKRVKIITNRYNMEKQQLQKQLINCIYINKFREEKQHPEGHFNLNVFVFITMLNIVIYQVCLLTRY